MRVLIVSHTYVLEHNCGKLRALARLPDIDEVHAVVPNRWRASAGSEGIVEPKAIVDGAFRRLPLAATTRRHQSALFFPGLARYIRQFEPHVIQVEQGTRSLALTQALRAARRMPRAPKVLFFTWWNLPYTLRGPARWLESHHLGRVDGAVAGNDDARSILRSHGLTRPILVQPQLGVGTQHFVDRPAAPSDAPLRLAYVGRLANQKGVDLLIDAVAKLSSLPWTLRIVGSGPEENDLRQQAQRSGVADRVSFRGSVAHDEVTPLLTEADVLVLPSRTDPDFRTLTARGWKEQFGRVLIEAMAAGAAVVGSDSGEIPNVIGDAGLVFEEGDASDLADKLRTLVANRASLVDLAQRGRQRARATYSDEVLADRLAVFYRSLDAGTVSP